MQTKASTTPWSGLKLPESILIVTNLDVFINNQKYQEILTTLLGPYHYLIYQLLFR